MSLSPRSTSGCAASWRSTSRTSAPQAKKARPLYFGTTVHRMIQAIAEGKSPRAALAEIADQNEQLFKEEREVYAKLIDDINFIMRAYQKFLARASPVFRELNGRTAEVPFAVKVDDGITCKGTIDGVVTSKGQKWLLENKTRKLFPTRTTDGAICRALSI